MLFEAAVIGAVSIPIGLLSGVAGIGVTFLFVNPLMTSLFDTQEQLKLVVSLPALLAATFFSIVILLISAACPPGGPAGSAPSTPSARRVRWRLRSGISV